VFVFLENACGYVAFLARQAGNADEVLGEGYGLVEREVWHFIAAENAGNAESIPAHESFAVKSKFKFHF
jgi:hypothetical protein